MSKFRKRPVVIEASQWFENGDHPLDVSYTITPVPGDGEPFLSEGTIVRRYRHPDVPGEKLCEQCAKPHHIHGWIDTLEQGHRVCPGDWIITGVKGERYPIKNEIFLETYEAVDATGYTRSPRPDVNQMMLEALKPFAALADYLEQNPGRGDGVIAIGPMEGNIAVEAFYKARLAIAAGSGE